MDIDDDGLLSPLPSPRPEGSPPTSITNTIHLFKLAQLNSEIKYIANSISRKTPAYTYPQIPDVLQWQADVLTRLRQWEAEIPQLNQTQTKLGQIKYHEVVMLLLRPSPAIPNPSQETLHICHESAIATIRTFDQLYRGDLLVFNWQTLHSIFLATVTMLYCTWSVPSVTRSTNVETLMMDLKTSSNVLSALAEHFVDASRSRDILDELSSVTLRWLLDSQKQARTAPISQPIGLLNETAGLRSSGADSGYVNRAGRLTSAALEAELAPLSSESSIPTQPFDDFLNSEPFDDFLNSEPWDALFGTSDDSSFPFQIDTIMQGVFNDFQPDFEFGQNLSLENK